MNFQEADEALTCLFQVEWGETCSVQYDDIMKVPEQGKEFVRITVRWNDGGQRTLGSTGKRSFGYDGALTIQVATPKGEAGQRNRELVRQALTIFEDANITDLWLRNGHPETVGNDNNGYYLTNVIFDVKVFNIS